MNAPQFDMDRLTGQAVAIREFVKTVCPGPVDGLMAMLMATCAVAYENCKEDIPIDGVDDMLRACFNGVNEAMRNKAERLEKR